ncbi:translation initiation factor IF-2-like isoform X2 [Pristis pectinata]|nr:translation initiation factor IF-2-like isoform X2 [Pristis pectinata]
MAQSMKEYVDSSTRGFAKQRAMPRAPSSALPNAAPTGPVGEEGTATPSPSTTLFPGLEEQDPGIGLSTFTFLRSMVTGPPEEEGTSAIGPSAKPLPGLQEQEIGTGQPTQPSHQQSAARTHEDEGAPTSSLPITPFPGLKDQNPGIGPSTFPFPRSMLTGPPEEEGTLAIGPSAKPFPGLQEQDIGTGRPTQPSHQQAAARTHEDEGAPTSGPPTTLSPGPPEQMGEPSLQVNTQGQPVTRGDVPTGQEPTETGRARYTGAPVNHPDGSEADKGRTTARVPSPGTTRRGGGPRSGEGVLFGITPDPGSSQKRHGGAGDGGGNKSGLHVFLGILGVLTFLIILGMIAHKNCKRTRVLQAAQIRLIRYSRIIGSGDEIV